MEREIIVKNLINGEKNHYYRDLTVRNVKVSDPDGDYSRISLTLDKQVKQIVTDAETGETSEREQNVVFNSSISILALLKDNDDAAFAANYLSEHPKALESILSRATINLVQEFVPAGTEYKNPFSSKEDTRVFDGDRYITHITDIKISERGLRSLDKIDDILLAS